jgi:hypothetical protein
LRRGGLADAATVVADQKNDKIARRVGANAGKIRVTALDTMDEAVTT